MSNLYFPLSLSLAIPCNSYFSMDGEDFHIGSNVAAIILYFDSKLSPRVPISCNNRVCEAKFSPFNKFVSPLHHASWTQALCCTVCAHSDSAQGKIETVYINVNGVPIQAMVDAGTLLTVIDDRSAE